MNRITAVFVCLALYHFADAEDNKYKCTQPLAKAGSKQFPDIFSNRLEYSLKMELLTSTGSKDKEYSQSHKTVIFQEYRFNAGTFTKGRLDTFQDGLHLTIVTDQMSGNLYQAQGGNCTVFGFENFLKASKDFFYWHFEDVKNLAVGPSSVWMNAYNNKKNVPVVNTRTDVIRGIDVDIYQSCDSTVLPSGEKQDVSVQYAVSSKSGNPVQVNVEGTFVELGKPAYRKLSMNYFSLEDFIEDPSIMNVPTGLGCKIQEKTKVDFSLMFTFKGEVVTTGSYDDEVTHGTLYYDHKQDTSALFLEEEDGKGIVLNDLKRGVSYTIYETTDENDKDVVECHSMSTRAISKSLTSGRHHEGTGVLFQLTESRIFYGQNAQFYYLGMGKERGIDVEIKEAVIMNFYDKIMDRRYHKVVITYYLSSDRWFQFDTIETEKMKKFPVKISRVGYDEANNITHSYSISIFDYDVNKVQDQMGEVYQQLHLCHSQNGQKILKISFERPGGDDGFIHDSRDLFTEQLRQKLADAAKITPIRISYIQFEFDSMNLNALIVLTDRIDPLKRFVSKGYESIPSRAKVVYKIQTANECAERCLADTTCKAIYYDDSCYHSTVVVPEVGGSSYYSARKYVRTTMTPGESSIEFTFQDLLAHENALHFTLKVPASVSNKSISYVSTSLTEEDFRGQDTTKSKLMVTSIEEAGMTMKAADLGISTTNTKFECERKCRKNKLCESASYCNDNAECALTTTFLEHNNVAKHKFFKYDTSCVIMIKPYLESFKKYDGKVTLESPDKTATDAFTEKECAKACLQETSFDCQSFQYCKKTMTCNLFKTSFLPFNNDKKLVNGNSATCTLYMRSIMKGFKSEGEHKISGYNGNAIVNIDAYHCYKECLSATDGSCNSYDYCESYTDIQIKGLCILRHESVPPKSVKTKLSKTYTCKGYRRMNPNKDAFDSNPRDKPPKKSANKDKVGMSKGSLAGLGVGMVVVGILLVCGIFAIFITVTRKNSGVGDNMKISFSRQMDSDS